MMTRNLYDDNLDIFHTRLNLFGNSSGKIILEFPLMHTITALFYSAFGVHEVFGRIVSVIFSFFAMILMYGLSRQFLGPPGSTAALSVYALSPMNIFFSRAFMPESSMMFFVVAALYCFFKWIEKGTYNFCLISAVCAALACLVKPTAGLIFAPIGIAWLRKRGWSMFISKSFWLYAGIALVPLIVWGTYANHYNALQADIPSGFGGSWVQLIKTRGIIEHWFDPHFYIFVGGSITLLLLTPLGFIFGIIGVIHTNNSDKRAILYAWLLASIAYLYLLAGINHGHIYYHLILLPLAVLFVGFGVEWVWQNSSVISALLKKRLIRFFALIMLFIVILLYIVGYYRYLTYMCSTRMPSAIKVAEIIRDKMPGNNFILVNPYAASGVVAYYSKSNTQHFSVSDNVVSDLDFLRQQGATAYVALNTNYGNSADQTRDNKILWNYLNETCKSVSQNDQYLVFDLRIQEK